MKITSIELKILIKEFLTASNRVLSARFEIYSNELSKFIRFLESKPLILEYIDECGEPEFDVEKEVKEVSKSYGHLIFDLGSTNEKEVANIFAVLKYLSEHEFDGRDPLFYGYSSSNKYQDNVDGFGEKYVRFLITHIENYLSILSIKMGDNTNNAVNVEFKDCTLANAQVSVATDSATIHTMQNNGNDDKLNELIKTVLDSMECLQEEEKQIVLECIETIETLKEPAPKKGIIKMALKTIKGITGTTEFLASVAALVQFVQSMIGG